MPKTPKQVIAEQEKQAERDLALKRSQAVAPTKAAVPAILDTRTSLEQYLDQVAPSGIAGRLVKFTKEGRFIFTDTEEEIDQNEDFVVLANETLVSWIRFKDGGSPTRIGGLLFQGFTLPPREELGDVREADWPIGLNGTPEDPWKHEIMVVLRRPATLELATFATMSKTGRRAVGALLKHYQRLRTEDPKAFPVVRLKPGGYQDSRYGWVPTPNFVPVGAAAGLTPTLPDTSLGTQLGDTIRF